jgi:hypothetical protein
VGRLMCVVSSPRVRGERGACKPPRGCAPQAHHAALPWNRATGRVGANGGGAIGPAASAAPRRRPTTPAGEPLSSSGGRSSAVDPLSPMGHGPGPLPASAPSQLSAGRGVGKGEVNSLLIPRGSGDRLADGALVDSLPVSGSPGEG